MLEDSVTDAATTATGMTHPAMTAAEFRRFEGALTDRRSVLTGEAARVADTFAGVQGARGAGGTDGAHDAEASSLRTEWSRLGAFQGEFAEELAAIDRALQRLLDGSFGLCTRGGERIGEERLEARPASELCISCARQLESGRRA